MDLWPRSSVCRRESTATQSDELEAVIIIGVYCHKIFVRLVDALKHFVSARLSMIRLNSSHEQGNVLVIYQLGNLLVLEICNGLIQCHLEDLIASNVAGLV